MPVGSKATASVSSQAKKKKGQASSRVTGGQGLLTEAPTQKPSLLGQNKVS